MEAKVNISVTGPASDSKQMINLIMSIPNFAAWELRVTSSIDATPDVATSETESENSTTNAASTATHFSLKHLLTDTDRKIVKFVDEHDGEFYNADLAEELGVDTPLTCFPLGRITRKLQKSGVKIDGALGENWYTKQKTVRGTLLNVRADVMVKFREVLRD